MNPMTEATRTAGVAFKKVAATTTGVTRARAHRHPFQASLGQAGEVVRAEDAVAAEVVAAEEEAVAVVAEAEAVGEEAEAVVVEEAVEAVEVASTRNS
jgi:hypothetical protein